jgi:sulfite exporter TauE/SafE
MILWTAFMLGLAGSVHCVGMCGAIAVSLPYPTNNRWFAVQNAGLYNLGRISTYTFLGALLGVIGQGLHFIGIQQIFSIVLGVLLLLVVLFSINVEYHIIKMPFINRNYLFLKSKLGALLSKNNASNQKFSTFSVGLLNGFLPCGLVYMALAGAISQPTAWQGAAYMTIFGAGTFPLMFATAFFGRFVTGKWRKYFNAYARFALFAFAILFILRGMNLGIPYISPQVLDVGKEVICH